MDNLNSTQRAAVAQLQALTDDNCDANSAVSVLESVDWDIEKAANVLFGDQETSSFVRGSSTSSSGVNGDDLHLTGPASGGRPAGRSSQSSSGVTYIFHPKMLLSILAFPFHVLSGILRTLFMILRLPFGLSNVPPRFSTLTFLRRFSNASPKSVDPKSTADRWVRALEEETGASCVSRAGLLGTGLDDLESAAEDGKRVLPDFVVRGYEEALRRCERDARVGCVVLVSEEHDDVAEFKRTTLTNPNLVHLMHSNNFVVWGGDVRDPDAWSASQKLQATTFPFVAFVAVQPRRATGSNSTSRNAPSLTVLSRHQGASATAPETLVKHLEDQLLPRVTPFLERTRLARMQQERDRQLREEQDRAFQDAARRDRERLQERMEAERKKEEEERRRREEEETERRRKERIEGVKRRMRTWARETVVTVDGKGGSGEVVRIAVRAPDGGRKVLALSPNTSLTALYAYVEATVLAPSAPTEQSSEDHTFSETELANEIQKVGGADSWWGFKLALTYPRREVEWQTDICLRNVEGLQGGAQLVVEMCEDVKENEEEGDGYDTESDEGGS